jgi:glycosyltransferase involved in cell wall biosynthesis
MNSMLTTAVTPFFSVIIATYNRKKLTAKTINTILNQTFYNFEVIIIDDGSTDGSYSYLARRYSLEQRVKLFHQNNAERGAARNNGIQKAVGVYLVFVDSDDTIDSNHLEILYSHIIRESYPNFLTCKFDFIKNGKTTRAPIAKLSAGYYDYKPLLNGNTFGMYSCARRENPNLIKFEINPEYAIFEDWMYHFSNLYQDKIFLIDHTTYHINDHNDRSMRIGHEIICTKVNLAKNWIIDHVKLNPTEVKELNAFVHYFSAVHAYADSAPKEARAELKAACRIRGLCLPYIVLWAKCIVGKRFIDSIKFIQ